MNGDGFDDLIVGAFRADSSGNLKDQAGDSYVIFGAASPPATIDLNTLGSAGITLFGADAVDNSGYSVSDAGDVNGDGFDDLIVGANLGDAAGNGQIERRRELPSSTAATALPIRSQPSTSGRAASIFSSPLALVNLISSTEPTVTIRSSDKAAPTSSSAVAAMISWP